MPLKILLSLSIVFSLFLSSAVLSRVNADFQETVDAALGKDLYKEGYDFNTGGNLLDYGVCITGRGCESSDGSNSITGAIVPIQQSIGYLAGTPPVMVSEYIADVLHNSSFISQPAYAQGIGFSGLNPVLQLWKVFRNIAYFVYIIVFVIVGFMIMMRRQIDPQTVVSVQTALPKLIITLLLITFSYAIAGFVVDLIYLSIFVIISVFKSFGIIVDPTVVTNSVFNDSIFSIGWKYFVSPFEAAGSAANSIALILDQALLPSWLNWLSSSLAYLIIAIAILIALFRTLFSLVTAYVGIILATIFAPVELLANAVPGANTFSKWIRGLIANAAIFPVMVVMLIVGAYLVGGTSGSQFGIAPIPNTTAGFVPPLLGGTAASGPDQYRAIIGLGMIMLLPEVLKLTRKFFQAETELGEMAMANVQRGSDLLKAPFGAAAGFGTSVATQAAVSKVASMNRGDFAFWRPKENPDRTPIPEDAPPDLVNTALDNERAERRARAENVGEGKPKAGGISG